MKNDERTAYVTRDTILKLLSDDEVAKVSTAETASRLADGDEYLDLEHLDKGVRRAGALHEFDVCWLCGDAECLRLRLPFYDGRHRRRMSAVATLLGAAES